MRRNTKNSFHRVKELRREKRFWFFKLQLPDFFSPKVWIWIKLSQLDKNPYSGLKTANKNENENHTKKRTRQVTPISGDLFIITLILFVSLNPFRFIVPIYFNAF